MTVRDEVMAQLDARPRVMLLGLAGPDGKRAPPRWWRYDDNQTPTGCPRGHFEELVQCQHTIPNTQRQFR